MTEPPGRPAFLGISSFQVLAMFRRGMFYNYLSIYLRYFLGLSVTETTLFATFPMTLNILCQSLIWGRLSDRLQLRRSLIIIGEVSAAFATVLVWFVHTLPASRHVAGYAIIVGLSVVEVFWSMSNVGWSALLSDLYPARQRAGLQGRLLSMGGIGRMVGIWTGGLAYDGLSRFYDGWGFDKGLLFFIASGIMLVSTVPMWFVPEGGISGASHSPVSVRDLRARERFRRGKPLMTLRATLKRWKRDNSVILPRVRGIAGRRDQSPLTSHDGARVRGTSASGFSRQYLVFLLAMVFINFGRNSVALMKSQYLSLDAGFNLSSGVLSHVLNMGSLAIVLVGFSVDRLARRMKDWVLLLAGTATALVYLLGFAASHSLLLIFVSSFLSGASQVVIRASSYSYAARLIPPERRARLFAFYNATHFLSWGIPATLLAGPLVDGLAATGMRLDLAYRISFLAAASLVVVGGAILLVVVSRMRGTAEPPGGEGN